MPKSLRAMMIYSMLGLYGMTTLIGFVQISDQRVAEIEHNFALQQY